jgi:AraC family transcriptional regulator
MEGIPLTVTSIPIPRGSAAIETDPVSLQRIRGAIKELLTAIETTFEDEHETARECLRRASAILDVSKDAEAELSQGGASRPATTPPRGGLAPWQVCKVRNYIETHLQSPITTRDLAAVARLSPFHFCRAFRGSFSTAPHAYLMRRRIERAQGLMLQTNISLGQIAVDCGLADQAHFNRLFRRFVGESPGAWRRARAL